jgi:hypothetical protein
MSLEKTRQELEEIILKVQKKLLQIKNEMNDNLRNLNITNINKDFLNIKNDLDKCENEYLKLNELLNKNQNSYNNDFEYNIDLNYNKDKLGLFLTKLNKLINKQKEDYKNLNNKFISIQNEIHNNNNNNYNENELEMKYEDDDENDYMIPKQQIKNLNNIINNKNEQINELYTKTLLVNEISKEVNTIVHGQKDKLEDIESNIKDTEDNTKKTFKTILDHSINNKNNQLTKCYIILLLCVLLFFIIYILY